MCEEVIERLLGVLCVREKEVLDKREVSGKEMVVGSYCSDGFYKNGGYRVIKEEKDEYKYGVVSVQGNKELESLNARMETCMRDERRLWVDADMDNEVDVLVYTRRDGSSSICYCESVDGDVSSSSYGNDCVTLDEVF